jgi:hypothetical protein
MVANAKGSKPESISEPANISAIKFHFLINAAIVFNNINNLNYLNK